MKKTVDINKLFAEKKFSEIIYIIENKITDNQKNPQLINLLGVCRLLKGRASKNDLVLAIENFQNAFQRSNKINDIVEPYKNFINVSIKLYHYENSIQNNDYCFKNFQFALNFFDKNFELLSKLEKVVLAIIRIHKLFADVDKVDFYFSHLLKNNHLSVFNITNYIYYKSFNKKWSQLDFLESGKLLNDNLPLFNQNDLIPLNYKKQEKIRLGFLSADIYKKHSVTHFLKTILENYDENKYEIYLYLNHKLEDEDETTKLFRKLVKDSSNLIGLKDIEAINLIRNDKIDIMIDLMGVTSKNKLSLIKNRVSPIQISWCGYCNTTGIQEMDYLIADPNLILESEKKLYSEKIIFLPKVWNCHVGYNLKKEYIESPSIKSNKITFGSFNNFNKINSSVIQVWSKILKKVNNSKLILKSSSPLITDKLSKKFDEQKVLKSIEFLPYNKNFEEHLNFYKKIDISLDTFPYNGVTTSFEAIWMGVPVLTMKGYNFNSRCGESINKNLGINYLISENEDDYISKALELSKNHKMLQKIRTKIFEEANISPLFDKQLFRRNFFESLQNIYNS